MNCLDTKVGSICTYHNDWLKNRDRKRVEESLFYKLSTEGEERELFSWSLTSIISNQQGHENGTAGIIADCAHHQVH